MGATVAATGKKGDFTLLQLNANPPSGSVFLGWTSAPIANTDGAQVWRISNPDFGPQVYSEHNVEHNVRSVRRLAPRQLDLQPRHHRGDRRREQWLSDRE